MSDFLCYNVIIINNYCIILRVFFILKNQYLHFYWRWNEINDFLHDIKKIQILIYLNVRSSRKF